jgi:hypothetical protein
MKCALAAAVAILVLADIPAHAHHRPVGFLLDQRVTVEGKLVELKYANPHVLLRIRTADGTLYTAEWQSASWLQFHAHVELTTLRVGDELIVSGAPSRESESHELVRLKEVRRPRDGWTYQVVE